MAQAALFAAGEGAPERLTAWAPAQWPAAPDWRPLLDAFFDSGTGRALGQYIGQRLDAGATIYPPQPLRALELTALAEVKVVILGQDPYHGHGQAEGLAFSVAPGVRLPPSLRNIYKELARDPVLAPWAQPADGSLVHWAEQGVLLLNVCLTVEDGQPASHANRGWEVLTDSLIKAVLRRAKPVVFMLWGGQAQRLGAWIEAEAASSGGACLVLRANHPSPLSALRPPQPFIGCGHFGQANAFLMRHGIAPVHW